MNFMTRSFESVLVSKPILHSPEIITSQLALFVRKLMFQHHFLGIHGIIVTRPAAASLEFSRDAFR